MNRHFMPASTTARIAFAAAAVVVSLSTLTFIDSLAQGYSAAGEVAQQARIAVARR
jgi:ABC-type microcin C transport system permease subunit YejE